MKKCMFLFSHDVCCNSFSLVYDKIAFPCGFWDGDLNNELCFNICDKLHLQERADGQGESQSERG